MPAHKAAAVIDNEPCDPAHIIGKNAGAEARPATGVSKDIQRFTIGFPVFPARRGHMKGNSARLRFAEGRRLVWGLESQPHMIAVERFCQRGILQQLAVGSDVIDLEMRGREGFKAILCSAQICRLVPRILPRQRQRAIAVFLEVGFDNRIVLSHLHAPRRWP